MAEMIKHYFPKLVELHNFQAVHSNDAKKKNWQTLNFKVFKRLNFELSEEVIDSIVMCKTGTVERVLLLLRTKIDRNLMAGSNPAAVVPTVKRAEISNYPQQTLNLDAAAQLPYPTKHTSGAEYVPRIAYEEKVQELMAMDETIRILSMKVGKLDHLLHIKEVRIDELQRKLGEPSQSHAGENDAAQARQFFPPPQFAPPGNFNGHMPPSGFNFPQPTEYR
jgi:hypothetical protein